MICRIQDLVLISFSVVYIYMENLNRGVVGWNEIEMAYSRVRGWFFISAMMPFSKTWAMS